MRETMFTNDINKRRTIVKLYDDGNGLIEIRTYDKDGGVDEMLGTVITPEQRVKVIRALGGEVPDQKVTLVVTMDADRTPESLANSIRHLAGVSHAVVTY